MLASLKILGDPDFIVRAEYIVTVETKHSKDAVLMTKLSSSSWEGEDSIHDKMIKYQYMINFYVQVIHIFEF